MRSWMISAFDYSEPLLRLLDERTTILDLAELIVQKLARKDRHLRCSNRIMYPRSYHKNFKCKLLFEEAKVVRHVVPAYHAKYT